MNGSSEELAFLTFKEIIRLVDELAERLPTSSPLATLSTIQALVGRASELGDYCASQLQSELSDTRTEMGAPGYL